MANLSDDFASRGLRPAVARDRAGVPLWVLLAGGGSMGFVAFLWLSSHRPGPVADLTRPTADAVAAAASPAQATAPPAEVAALEAAARGAGSPHPAPEAVLAVPPAPLPQPAPDTLGKTPALIIDMGGPGGGASSVAAQTKTADKADADAPDGGGDTYVLGSGNGAPAGTAHATMLKGQSTLAPQGAMIPAVLETALDSDLPGFARAVVSRDVRSFDGSRVLVTRGSRLIGEYRSATAQAQARAFVIWTRIIRPDGATIDIGSPGADDLGRNGLTGKIDHHFFERFGGAILLSVVNAGGAALAGGPQTQVVVGSTQQATGLASTVTPQVVPPTIKVPQGTPIRVFVARDLDFSGAPEIVP